MSDELSAQDKASHRLQCVALVINSRFMVQPGEIVAIAGTLSRFVLGEPEPVITKDQEQSVRGDPAVPVGESVTNEHIACLECGKRFKSIKRHLNSVHSMSPESYRQRWGLAVTYPMVASDYAAQRSALAKQTGLGHRAATAE